MLFTKLARAGHGSRMVFNKTPIERRRVVVTGIGVVSPVGIGKDNFWSSLVAGESGVSPIESCTVEPKLLGYSRIAGQVKGFDPLEFLEAKQAKRMDRFIQFGVAAAKLARKDAKLGESDVEPTRLGVVVGSGAGGFDTVEKNFNTLMSRGPDRCSPFMVPMISANMASGWVSITNNAMGPSSCAVTACATSASAIGEAYRILERGEADVMLAGGTDACITGLGMAGFTSARALSNNNDDPRSASRPFDLNRDGFVIAEGASVLVLESLEHAKKRKAHIYAELIGYGQTNDAHDIVMPRADGEGAAAAMRAALAEANFDPAQIDYINAHGTSTRLGDAAETRAIKKVFGARASSVPVSSTKSMTGHMLGAAGAVESAACCLSIQNSKIPPTINLQTPDPDCDLDYVPNQARDAKVQTALSNSFGFGGHNVSLLYTQCVD
jgi:3-oxoacyl-[acyl-carrier-protein] synthase II